MSWLLKLLGPSPRENDAAPAGTSTPSFLHASSEVGNEPETLWSEFNLSQPAYRRADASSRPSDSVSG
jgi:hypothetical protein